MEEVVALKIRDRTRGVVGFITWGRVFDAVDEAELVRAVRSHAAKFGLKDVIEVSVCASLQEISSAPYFYEGLLRFAWEPVPFGKEYEPWRARKREAISAGHEIFAAGAVAE